MKIFKPILIHHEALIDILVYENQYELMYALCRFQEHYENPKYANKSFTRQDIQDWQPDYYLKWNGCNFPKITALNFTKKKGIVLDNHEKAALEHMKALYILGVHLGAESYNIKSVINHERLHAQYFSDTSYFTKCNNIIKKADKNLIKYAKENLRKMGYCENVLIDEIQAYSQSGWKQSSDLKLKKLSQLFIKGIT